MTTIDIQGNAHRSAGTAGAGQFAEHARTAPAGSLEDDEIPELGLTTADVDEMAESANGRVGRFAPLDDGSAAHLRGELVDFLHAHHADADPALRTLGIARFGQLWADARNFSGNGFIDTIDGIGRDGERLNRLIRRRRPFQTVVDGDNRTRIVGATHLEHLTREADELAIQLGAPEEQGRIALSYGMQQTVSSTVPIGEGDAPF